MLAKSALLIILLSVSALLQAQIEQDTTALQLKSPEKYIDAVAGKAKNLEEKLDKKSAKALAQFQKQEEKLRKKLSKIDSLAAKNIFSNAGEQYKQLQEKLKTPSGLTKYIPHLDSMSTSLNFLGQNAQLLSQAKDVKDKLKEAIEKTNALKAQLQKAEDIKKFLKERKEYLKSQLEKFGLAKKMKSINKKIYYYHQQVAEYVSIIKDPRRAEKKALELLAKTKLFQDFFRKNSMLASLFRMPGDPNDPAYLQSLAGLQTRAQVNSLIQATIQSSGTNGIAQFRQQLQGAQHQLNELKNKIGKFGGGSSEDIMPEGFVSNSQKVKSWLRRIEISANVQTQKATNFFPITTDIGLSLGFKISDRSTIGFGGSYKAGLGRGWSHIKFTSEGASIRSFLDVKLRKSFWLTGGYEMNYRTSFNNLEILKDLSAWQKSCLFGLSRTLPIKTKFLKQTKLQILWDALAKRQKPAAQSFIFRIGYTL